MFRPLSARLALVSLLALACGDINVASQGGEGGSDTPEADGGGDAHGEACTFGEDAACDDGDSCTVDQCNTGGTCEHTPATGVCQIGGECYADGAVSDLNPCKVCDTAWSKVAWSDRVCDEDGDPCTSDACDANAGCAYSPLSDVPCDDGVACTTDDTCQDGVCTATPCGCEADAECEGQVALGPCQRPACEDGECVAATDEALGGSDCDDGDACTIGDQCAGGACVGSALDCSVVSGPCASGQCVGGECALVFEAEGTACEPAVSCVVEATCGPGGNCLGSWDGEACGCSGDGECDDGLDCTADACVEGACEHTVLGGGCRLLDRCFAAGEAHPFDACQVCDPAVSQTEFSPNACDDGEPCTADVCAPVDGCVNTFDAEADCDDGNPCTDDTCTEEGCQSVPDDAGTCDDGDPCTTGDACTGGICAGATVDCSAEEDACHAATCVDGDCEVEVVGGASCDDADPCTSGDVCGDSGDCAGEAYSCAPLECESAACDGVGGCEVTVSAGFCSIGGACYAADAPNPGNPCERCDPSVSQGEWTAVTDGTACDADGDGCTVGDQCAAGICEAGDPAVCDDGLACTGDVCVSGGADAYTCDHAVAAGDCLIGGVCYTAGAINPDDPCLTCGAEPADWVAVPDGSACDADGSGCTQGDSCQGGTCTPGGAPDCGDGLGCTEDVCTSTGANTYGCSHPLSEGSCLIAGTCYATGSAKPGNSCQVCGGGTSWSNVDDGTTCDADGDGCTMGDSCQAGTCQAGAPATCDDGLACTADQCTSGGASSYDCTFTVKAGSCLIGGTCYASGAANPANPCQECNPSESATSWSDRPNGTSCNADGDGCTEGDSCQAGSCTPGAAPSCSDGKSCTDDTCNSTGASSYSCSNPVKSGSCLIGGGCYDDGAVNPGNACQWCDGGSPATWSSRPNGTSCNADGNGCTVNDSCQSGSCKAGSAPSCSDGKSCTNDVCTSTGASSYTCSNPLKSNFCLISGTCYADGAAHPSNACKRCNDSSPTTWSNQPNGTSCNADSNGCTQGDSCQSGSCTAGSAPSCGDNVSCTDDVCTSTGSTTYSCSNPIASDKCLINGTCYSSGQRPTPNACIYCAPFQSQTSWSDHPICEFCNGGAFCTKSSDCGSDGFCSNNSCICY